MCGIQIFFYSNLDDGTVMAQTVLHLLISWLWMSIDEEIRLNMDIQFQLNRDKGESS